MIHYMHMQGKAMVAVTSGANMNFDRLRLVTELADLGANVGSFPAPLPRLLPAKAVA